MKEPNLYEVFGILSKPITEIHEGGFTPICIIGIKKNDKDVDVRVATIDDSKDEAIKHLIIQLAEDLKRGNS